MNILRRTFNQNREQVIIAIAIIAFILIIIHTLNALIGKENEQKKNNYANSSTNTSTTISKTERSVITGEKVQTEDNNINTNLIKEFVGYCNIGDIEKAYNLLSNECKTLLYPTVEVFKQNYYNNIFSIKRIYGLENWFSESSFYTYYIKYSEDILETGNAKSANNRSDYITVVKENNGYYLNINNYIGRKYRNSENAKDSIAFKVNYIDMYIDYTILNISVTNNSNNTIWLDSKESVNSTYLYDENNVKYTSFLNENAEELIIKPKVTNTINVKFNKLYNPEREVYGVTFGDVVLNYETYKTDTNSKITTSIDVRI